jgi:hypothetical protein
MSKIGNLNEDNFEMGCIVCGSESGLCLIAHRDTRGKIVGFVVVCKDCKAGIYSSTIGILPKT